MAKWNGNTDKKLILDSASLSLQSGDLPSFVALHPKYAYPFPKHCFTSNKLQSWKFLG